MFGKIITVITLILLNNMFAQIQKPTVGKIDLYKDFKSKYVTSRNIEVWLPEGYNKEKKYAVLYMQDGQMLFDSTTTWNKQSWKVDVAASKLMSSNETEDFIIVGIWNGGATRHQDYLPQKPFESLTQQQKDTVTKQLQQAGRTKEIFNPDSDNYLKFLVEEVKPFIDSTYSVFKDKNHTFIAGSSMGALISFYAVIEYPNIFSGAACLSTHWPGTFKLENNPMPKAFALYLKENLNKLNGNKIYFDHGDKTLDSLYPSLQKKIDKVMDNYPKEFWRSLYFKGKDHSEKSWQERVSIPIKFLLNKINKPKQFSLQTLPVGTIKPTGWLKKQMQKDMAGFVGNLDKLVPQLISDPIYGKGRLHKNSKAKELGNLKSGDAEGDEQYKWWNSETQSNWWDGFIRNAIMLKDKNALKKVKSYVKSILDTQGEDGYLGIYDRELRFKFKSENGELWSKTTLLRGLLAYYEYSNDKNVWNAIVKAVENVMVNYPINNSNPFFAGKEFAGGVAHGLTFTDVLEKMYQLTGNKNYLTYAEFLFDNFNHNYSSEQDVQLKNILSPDYKLQCHGVHTFEHLRPLLVAAYSSGNQELLNALDIYLSRINSVTTVTGGPIGDEWIAARDADATNTGYEYCSIHELLDSYSLLFLKSGNETYADKIENIFYNAAQGSRNPENSTIAYLKTDNSYEMSGTRNGEVEPDRNQTRYKYSPAHQDVAVCCAPNAGRITPYFIQSSWMKENDSTLVAALLMPNILETEIKGIKLSIENKTNYPYQNKFLFKIQSDKENEFTLKIRIPNWVNKVVTKENYKIVDSFAIIKRRFRKNDRIEISFITDVKLIKDLKQKTYFSYGALIYAAPIKSIAYKGKKYLNGFEDYLYKPHTKVTYDFLEEHMAEYSNTKLSVNLLNNSSKKTERIKLIPITKTILRQASF